MLALAAVAAVFVIVGGGEDDPTAPEKKRAAATATAEPSPSPTATTAEESSEDPPPAAAVREFYEAAAAGDFDRAWELSGPEYRAAFGSQAGLEGTFRTLERIRFRSLDVVKQTAGRATVRISTVATHAEFSERCRGTLFAVKVEGEWRVDPEGVRCDRG